MRCELPVQLNFPELQIPCLPNQNYRHSKLIPNGNVRAWKRYLQFLRVEEKMTLNENDFPQKENYSFD